MYDKIGKRIKNMADAFLVAGIVICCVIGFLIIIKDFERNWWKGILIAVTGMLASRAGSLLIYGFGQLIENTDVVRYCLNISLRKIATEYWKKQEDCNLSGEPLYEWIKKECPNCGCVGVFGLTCPRCGKPAQYARRL